MFSDFVAAAAHRRRVLARKIGNGIVALSTAAPAHKKDNYLFYFTACAEPQTALLLAIEDGDIQEEIFFCRPADATVEQWEGTHLNPKTARRRLNIDRCEPLDKFTAILTDLARRHSHLYYLPGRPGELDKIAIDLVRQRRTEHRSRRRGLHTLLDIAFVADEMRLIKDKTEIAALRESCRITANGVSVAMQAAMTAKTEYEVEAAIIHTYRRHGAKHAFSPIVASGKNACVLHYTKNNARLRKDRLLLVDTGCAVNGYAGDITRTFPPDGEWRGAQRDVFEIVLNAQRHAIRAAKPGRRWSGVEQAARRQLTDGLRMLKICRGSVDNILRQGSYRRFYMHQVGHSLGLDVHDVGAMEEADGGSRVLRPGMVMTIEPGLYIPATDDIPPSLRGIGVRIEDDVLVTAKSNEVLTADAPKTTAEIKAWLQA